MANFDLDLQAVEEHIDEELEGNVVLGILDGTTDPETWLETVSTGNVLVLCVEGDVNELASGFARDIKESGGSLVHFRGFLIVAPPGIDVDTDQL
ncbi:DUF5779 family protein [Halobacteria archaeon AArc-dxtr1]|nr:DUF5779 family protein [Halobacteria archaeon AArc-dxtr1]